MSTPKPEPLPPSRLRAMPPLMSAGVAVVVAMVAAINLALPKLSGSSLGSVPPAADGLDGELGGVGGVAD